MQVRRAVLAFAIALLFAAVVSSLAPPPATRDGDPGAPPAITPPPPRAGSAGDGAVEIRVDADRGRPVVRRVDRGTRVVLTVEVAEPGDVSIPALGRHAAADGADPAVFDVLPERPGRFSVVFSPTEGGRRVVARLVVGEPARRDEPAAPR